MEFYALTQAGTQALTQARTQAARQAGTQAATCAPVPILLELDKEIDIDEKINPPKINENIHFLFFLKNSRSDIKFDLPNF